MLDREKKMVEEKGELAKKDGIFKFKGRPEVMVSGGDSVRPQIVVFPESRVQNKNGVGLDN
jgi:hypothetical protein